MKTTVKRETHNIDASGKVLGRLATEIAGLLIGKHKPSFQPYIDGGDFVEVENIKDIKVTGKKMAQKEYFHHSNYPGGIKSRTMKQIFDRDPAEILHLAVSRMLPKNKHRTNRLKRLKIS